MKSIDVLVVGSLNFDIIMKQQRLPNIGETYTVETVKTSPGGKGANQAVQCSKLGLKTAMLGKVGKDLFGQELLNSLHKYNVNTEHIEFADVSTGLGIVNSFPSGELIANIYQGANYEVDESYVMRNIDLFKKAKIVILQLEIPIIVVERLISIAKEFDCLVILNAAPSVEISIESLQLVDILVLNEVEASFYSGCKVDDLTSAEQASKIINATTGKTVIITVGSKGSVILAGNEFEYFSPYPSNVVETTGAGDSYVGGIAYSNIHSFSIKEMGLFASKVSAKTIQNIGAQESMPFLNEID